MSFAHDLGPVDIAHWLALVRTLAFKFAAGRDYQTAYIDPPAEYARAFFLKLPPHSALHPHVDANDCETHHVVVQTNPACLNWWRDQLGDHALHMELGREYRVDRGLLHWAVNDGETDRIHLLLER